MIGASIIFWLVCVLPLLAIFVYMLRKDKIKGRWGMIVLVVLVLFALFAIVFMTSDFSLKPY